MSAVRLEWPSSSSECHHLVAIQWRVECTVVCNNDILIVVLQQYQVQYHTYLLLRTTSLKINEHVRENVALVIKYAVFRLLWAAMNY